MNGAVSCKTNIRLTWSVLSVADLPPLLPPSSVRYDSFWYTFFLWSYSNPHLCIHCHSLRFQNIRLVLSYCFNSSQTPFQSSIFSLLESRGSPNASNATCSILLDRFSHHPIPPPPSTSHSVIAFFSFRARLSFSDFCSFIIFTFSRSFSTIFLHKNLNRLHVSTHSWNSCPSQPLLYCQPPLVSFAARILAEQLPLTSYCEQSYDSLSSHSHKTHFCFELQQLLLFPGRLKFLKVDNNFYIFKSRLSVIRSSVWTFSTHGFCCATWKRFFIFRTSFLSEARWYFLMSSIGYWRMVSELFSNTTCSNISDFVSSCGLSCV